MSVIVTPDGSGPGREEDVQLVAFVLYQTYDSDGIVARKVPLP
jgi:hypothetical protein